MIRFAADAFLGYSMILLRFSAMAAFVLLPALIGLAIYSIYGWLYLDVTPGWTSIMISIIVIALFQLTALSIIGEYVGRIYLSTKSRPLFIIDEVQRGSHQCTICTSTRKNFSITSRVGRSTQRT